MMRKSYCLLAGAMLLGMATTASAQQTRKTLTPGDVYCSGMVSASAVPADTYIISGEQSNHQTIYSEGEIVYVNKGSSSGVKVGDRFQIMRPLKNPRKIKWFRYENALLRAMGTQYADIGHVQVVHVESSVAIARVTMSCDYLQRGDIALPFSDRPTPQISPFDGNRWPAPSGKQQAMVVSAREWALEVAMNDVIYVNMGSSQGAKPGDVVRIYRYQGTRHDTVYQARNTQYAWWGFGKTPIPYKWNDLPRELLGEGVILRSTDHASTVFIAHILKPIFMGDYVEIK